jgi:uncharacterized membrane protein YoaK (UPF0700 family)
MKPAAVAPSRLGQSPPRAVERSRRIPTVWFLASVAGTVDAVGYLALLHVFVANMSGNSVKLGTYLAQGEWGLAARSGVPVAVFVVGVSLGVVAGELVSHRTTRLRLPVLLLVEAAALLAAAACGSTMSPAVLQRGFTAGYGLVAVLLVMAMSLQTAALQRVNGRTVRTTYVTGMLTTLATDAALHVARRLSRRRDAADEDRGWPTWLAAGVWACYLGGAVVGAAGESAWRFWWLAAPIAALIVGAACDLAATHSVRDRAR